MCGLLRSSRSLVEASTSAASVAATYSTSVAAAAAAPAPKPRGIPRSATFSVGERAPARIGQAAPSSAVVAAASSAALRPGSSHSQSQMQLPPHPFRGDPLLPARTLSDSGVAAGTSGSPLMRALQLQQQQQQQARSQFLTQQHSPAQGFAPLADPLSDHTRVSAVLGLSSAEAAAMRAFERDADAVIVGRQAAFTASAASSSKMARCGVFPLLRVSLAIHISGCVFAASFG